MHGYFIAKSYEYQFIENWKTKRIIWRAIVDGGLSF